MPATFYRSSSGDVEGWLTFMDGAVIRDWVPGNIYPNKASILLFAAFCAFVPLLLVKNDSSVFIACRRFAFPSGWRCTADGGSVSIPSSAMGESSRPPSGKLVMRLSRLGHGLFDLSVVVTDPIAGSCVSSSARARAPVLSVTPLTWMPALLINSAMLASN
jgi:hypothetical protein